MKSKSREFRNSQAWSLDIMLAVVIFIGTIFFFYAMLDTNHGSKAEELEDEASQVFKDILSQDSDVRIAE